MQRKRLLLIWIVMLLVFAAAEIGMRMMNLPEYRTTTEQLMDHQIAKVRELPDGAVVFLGDSSLGYAIDSSTASEILGKPVVNLALSSLCVTIGDAFMLNETLKHSKPREVVIMHTLEMWPCELRDDMGAALKQCFTGAKPDEPLPWRVASHLALARDSRHFKRMYFSTRLGIKLPGISPKDHSVIHNDYVIHSAPLPWTNIPAIGMGTFRISSDAEEGLHATLRTCAEANIPVTIVSSVLRAQVVDRSATYLHEADMWLRNIAAQYPGARIAWTMPTPLPDHILGDTLSHLRPALKRPYTRWFIGRLYGNETRTFADYMKAEAALLAATP